MSSALPYQDPHHPLFHRGVVSVTGTKNVDLGIGHANFYVMPSIKGAQANLESAPGLAWDHVAGSPGVFKISVSKLDTGNLDTDPATAAVDVCFIALVDSSVL